MQNNIPLKISKNVEDRFIRNAIDPKNGLKKTTFSLLVAQLAERSFPTPEIRSLNPNINKVLSTYCKLIRKDVNKEKEAGNGPS